MALTTAPMFRLMRGQLVDKRQRSQALRSLFYGAHHHVDAAGGKFGNVSNCGLSLRGAQRLLHLRGARKVQLGHSIERWLRAVGPRHESRELRTRYTLDFRREGKVRALVVTLKLLRAFRIPVDNSDLHHVFIPVVGAAINFRAHT